MLLQSWDAPGLSPSRACHPFRQFAALYAGPIGRHHLTCGHGRQNLLRLCIAATRWASSVRTAVLSVSRKNGKTQLAAALCLCAFSGPESELRGECYSLACTKDQAGRIFNEMVAIITRTPWLNERVNIIRFRRELEDMANGSTFRVLSADVAPVHGLDPNFVCYDELGQVPNRELYDALSTALGRRLNR